MAINRDDINIISTEAWANRIESHCPHGVLGIDWVAENIGFGRLELVFDEDGRAHIYSECMDSNDDKSFTKAVLMKVIEDAIIEE